MSVTDKPIESPNAGEPSGAWRKAIPLHRDEQQSRALVAAAGAFLLALTVDTVLWVARSPMIGPLAQAERAGLTGLLIQSTTASAIFGLVAWRVKAATAAAAAMGGMICLLVTFWTFSGENLLRSGLTPLVVLFVLTFLSTRAGKKRKIAAGLAEGLGRRRPGRTASQILANLAAAALSSAVPGLFFHQWMQLTRLPNFAMPMLQLLTLAAMAEATADTVSSEIGQAFGGRPVLITQMKRVEPGTDGAVSLVGTLAGIGAAFVVVGAGVWAMQLIAPLGTIKLGTLALGAGIAGLFLDSLLGATVERWGWLGNDLVNFTSTVFAAGVAFFLFFMV